MKIELHEISIADIVNGYKDDNEGGVVGYGGRLNIRPAFQREFIYGEKQRNEVINTVKSGFPLNTMYWVKSTGGYELMDGQQRTVSICQYVDGGFAVDNRYFHNLTSDEKQQILNYKLMVYICEGTDSEKLAWFKIINIAGEKLTDQELRNAIYTGPWLADAKKYFSKTSCAAYQIGSKLVNGSPIRQEYLEKVLEWISDRDGVDSVEAYMAKHQHDKNATEQWLYFQSVINWVNALFTNYRKEMKGVAWGLLYNRYKDEAYDPDELETEVKALMMDDDVTNKKGIYPYLITHEERYLNIRAFTPAMKRAVYEKQKHKCKICKKTFEFEQMEGDHITPWCEGGKTEKDNCQMLCRECNRRKSNK